MKEKNKNLILVCIIVGVLILTLGVTYSVLTFNETGTNQDLVLGDIWMRYTGEKVLTIENATPGYKYDDSRKDNYFEFQVTGKNTYEKENIYYEIMLTHGENHETRTTRIDDKFLMFKLVEVKDDIEIILFDDKNYESLYRERIWVDTIGANDGDYSKTYRLYMWISNDVVIGNTGSANYSMETWNNEVFASIKVDVYGDFEEKSLGPLPTDATCFITLENEDGTLTIDEYLVYNPTSAEHQNEKCTKDVIIPSQIDGKTVTVIGNRAFSDQEFHDMRYKLNSVYIPNTIQEIGNYAFWYSELSSVIFEENSNLTTIGDAAFYRNNLTSLVIPDGVTTIGGSAFSSNYLTSIVIPETVVNLGTSAFSNNKVTEGQLFIYNRTDTNGDGIAEIDTTLNSYVGASKDISIPNGVSEIKSHFFSNMWLTSVVIPDSVTKIGDYAFNGNNLTSVTIPNGVTSIGNSAFSSNKLTSVVISNGVTSIGYSAFSNNDLTSVEIPNSVTTIGKDAFSYNDLTSVTIGSGIQYIDERAFEKSSYSNENLESITFTSKTCEEIKNIEESSTNTTKYFPWLYSYSPYYKEGYKVKVFGTDGECSY